MIQPAEIVELWTRHAAGLVMLARSRCWSDAEDLVQEAFVRLAAQTERPEEPLAWLATTVRNLAIDQARINHRRRRRERVVADERAEWFTEGSLLDSDCDPQQLRQLLEQLKDTEREIVIAHVWNGLTFRQIARMLGKPASTVHRRYAAVLDTLRIKLKSRIETKR